MSFQSNVNEDPTSYFEPRVAAGGGGGGAADG